MAFREHKEKKNGPVPMEVDKMMDEMMKMMAQEDARDDGSGEWENGVGGHEGSCAMNNIQAEDEMGMGAAESMQDRREMMM